jgi:hypothetical protein
MVDFCKYKNIFGEPGKGVHKYRLGGIAVVDMGLTILLAAVTTWIWHRRHKRAKPSKVVCYFLLVLLILILIGIFLHWLFCVDTALNRSIGL